MLVTAGFKPLQACRFARYSSLGVHLPPSSPPLIPNWLCLLFQFVVNASHRRRPSVRAMRRRW